MNPSYHAAEGDKGLKVLVPRYVHGARGITISGEWHEDLQHGHGVEVWEGGARYEGSLQGFRAHHFSRVVSSKL